MEENVSIVYEGETLQNHMVKCFMWMFIGLLITATEAYILIMSGAVAELLFQMKFVADGYGMSILLLVPMFIQLGITIYLTKRLFVMSVTRARVLFVVYALITGLTFSILPSIFDVNSMFYAFGFSAVLFGSLAVIGGTMKMDLTKYTSLFAGALLALIIISLLAMFLKLQGLDLIISYVGLFLFLAITAYDVQKIKKNFYIAKGDYEVLDKLSIFGALQLYLDFVNIFLYVLRILGRRK